MERVAALVRPALSTARQAVRLFDLCCGTGTALRQLADAVGGETYDIEIEGRRAEEPGRFSIMCCDMVTYRLTFPD